MTPEMKEELIINLVNLLIAIPTRGKGPKVSAAAVGRLGKMGERILEKVERVNPFGKPRSTTKPKDIFISDKQAQSKYKHAETFGLPKNYNKENATKFKDAIQNHIKSTKTKQIEGTYRGNKVTHYYNKDSNINVMKDQEGNFISGWKLNSQQKTNLLRTGNIGGSKCLALI